MSGHRMRGKSTPEPTTPPAGPAGTSSPSPARGADQAASNDDQRIEYMRLDDIVEAERNSKLHDLEELDRAVTSLGFVTELKYDERVGKLIRGHGRLADLRRKRDRGETPPEGIRDLGDDWAAPVVRGWASRSRAHATAVALADNVVGKAAGHDDDVLHEELAELSDDAPDLLHGISLAYELERLEAAGGERTDLDQLSGPAPWDTGQPDPFAEREPRDPVETDRDEQWETGTSPDEGSSREEEAPGPLDVEPAWRTLEPLRARYHDGTAEGADRVARWLRTHAADVHVGHDLAVTWRGRDGEEYLPPGKWVTRFLGRLDVRTREEMADTFVAANEPARRADRDAKPVTVPALTDGQKLLRHGSGAVTGTRNTDAP